MRRTLAVIVLLALPVAVAADTRYAWTARVDPAQRLEARLAPPAGYARVSVAEGSFGAWLRGLPLLPGRPDVRLHDGGAKNRQDVHEAILDIDVGRRDLQQCADAVMRLRAEYLFGSGQADAAAFTLTSGDRALARDWMAGQRPRVSRNRVRFAPGASADRSHASFRRWLDFVFTYAGSASLSRELPAAAGSPVAPGDVFVQGGFPGHAVIVLDVAKDARGRAVFLLAQSYMPAQQIHVLRNLADPALGAWFAEPTGTLLTPEWTFQAGDRRRWP